MSTISEGEQEKNIAFSAGAGREEMAAEAENNRDEKIRIGTIAARALLAEKQRQSDDSARFSERLRNRPRGH